MVTKTKEFDHLLVISGLGPYAKALMDYNLQTCTPFHFGQFAKYKCILMQGLRVK